ncbi:hypothetical protein C0993_004821, partial [Termitomyces sp. T159_Od127]
VNVLIDSAGRAALGGFGQSGMAESQKLERSTQSSMASKGGTIRWQAPELFLGQEDLSKEVCNTKESDIFAWAGVCYEVNARQPVFPPCFELASRFLQDVSRITRSGIRCW